MLNLFFMKLGIILLGVMHVIFFSACSGHKKLSPEMRFVRDNVEFASLQTDNMVRELGEPDENNYPRTLTADGKLKTTSMRDWTPGFFPGNLWYLYELTGDEKWKNYAVKWTDSLEELKYFKDHHDIGFMMYCSYGNAERLAPESKYPSILIQSAESLCTRYNDTVKAIKSWNYREAWNGNKWYYPVIIDNMMNLELLFYAYKATGDRKFYDIAVNHANTTLKNQFRPDFGSYHVVNYDPATGEALHRQTCQGYSDNSTWARGQAWAVYGFTMMYRETKDVKYLDAARHFADYYIKHLPEDLVPNWDFNAGQQGYAADGKSYAKVYDKADRLKDASATAIVCSALFELADLSGNKEYRKTAIAMLKSLSSDKYRAKLGENGNFIIMHCTGSLPHKAEIDVPLVYADYYYLEALARYKRILE